jgi:predicted nucleotidyltransferase
MRLSQKEVAIIRESAEAVFGDQAQVWLFGSRVDDARRGGDIDLLIRPAPGRSENLLREKIRFLGMLERALGERRIDVVIERRTNPQSIEKIALETGVRL